MEKLGYCTLREKLVDAIRVKILKGELEPGMRIIEQDLSEEFGVSRGPIREALRQIEQEGLIEYKRNAGCSVKKITLEDIHEIYLLVSTYEILAVESYDGKFSDEDFRRMDKILELMKDIAPGDYQTVVAYDGLLHHILVEKSGMERLIKAWTDLSYGNIISCYAGKMDPKQISERQYPIHKKLVDACKTEDVNKIREAIKDHYMLTIRRLLKEEREHESLEI